MKKILLITKLFVTAIFVTTIISCEDNGDDPIVQPKTIVQTAQSDPNLSILVQALTRANLVNDVNGVGPITVFAPTNAAFTAFLQAKNFANLEAVPIPVLRQILLNHVVSGSVKAADLPVSGYFKTSATFGTTTSKISNFVSKTTLAGVTTVNINGAASNFGANVTTADIMASNGVIHVINGVIDVPTIVSHAIANPNFSTLVTVLTSTTGTFGNQAAVFAVVNTATTAAPLTVFAPINAAFATAVGAGGFANTATPGQVSTVLQYHVIGNANILAGTLTEGQVATTASGQTFIVTLAGGAKITDKSTTKANIIQTDVQASNGIIHAVDKVLQPTL